MGKKSRNRHQLVNNSSLKTFNEKPHCKTHKEYNAMHNNEISFIDVPPLNLTNL
jgi:hypothetical protein